MRLFRVKPEKLIGWSLPERPEDVPPIEVLASQLASGALSWRALVRRMRFGRRGYTRRVLYRNAACELVLACWLPGQASAIHDHGGSYGAVRVLRGTLTETVFAWRGNMLRPVRRNQCHAGDVTLEHPETIHRVENTSTEGAVTLHLYTPPIRNMVRMDVASAPPDLGPATAIAV